MRHNGKRIAFKSFAGDYRLYSDDVSARLESCECETCRKACRKSVNEHMDRAGRA